MEVTHASWLYQRDNLPTRWHPEQFLMGQGGEEEDDGAQDQDTWRHQSGQTWVSILPNNDILLNF